MEPPNESRLTPEAQAALDALVAYDLIPSMEFEEVMVAAAPYLASRRRYPGGEARTSPPITSVLDAIATAIGYDRPRDGLLGSGFSKMLAYQTADQVAKALGLAPTLDVEHVRRWGAGEVTHLGPDSPRLKP